MSRPLDILALEPFYGGVRRAMLEALVKSSRHRWTVLRLPPRRIERRLTTAANWFSEQLSRHWVGRLDLLFTSEAMNLANLLRLTPALAAFPSVVYFHDNQLPDPEAAKPDQPTDLVNLGTATAASEIWFNSAWHRQAFLARATALVEKHPELSSHNPMPAVSAKSRLMPPPIDWALVESLKTAAGVKRQPRTVFFETRDANLPLLNEGLALVRQAGVEFNAITVGPVNQLDPTLPRFTVSEYDEPGQVRGMLESGVFLSAKPSAASDYLAIRALLAGCEPVLPDAGVYREILPKPLHASHLYYVDAEGLAENLQDALTSPGPWKHDGFRDAFQEFDAALATRAIDDRLEQLAAEHARRPVKKGQ
jgi:hypothetical protein